MNKTDIINIFKTTILPDLHFWYELDMALDLPQRKAEWKTLNNTCKVNFSFPEELETILPSREEISAVTKRGISENVVNPEFVQDLL